MIPLDRLNQIKRLLTEQKTITTNELCEKLYSSPSTIRRDLVELENAGILRRIHGGATLIADTTTDFSYSIRAASERDEKEYMAKLASDYIKDDMSIYLDTSSTASYVTPYINSRRNMTVITNCLEIALRLRNNSEVKLFLAGGQVKPFSSAILGEQCHEFISYFKTDLAIISCKCLDAHHFYEAEYNIANIKRIMIQNTTQTLLLCDSTKFDATSLINVGDYSNIDTIITDKAPKEHYLKPDFQTKVIW